MSLLFWLFGPCLGANEASEVRDRATREQHAVQRAIDHPPASRESSSRYSSTVGFRPTNTEEKGVLVQNRNIEGEATYTRPAPAHKGKNPDGQILKQTKSNKNYAMAMSASVHPTTTRMASSR